MLIRPTIELTTDQKEALQGTYGDPSDVNRYMTATDPVVLGDRTATGIRTTTTIVVTSGATAPTAGQVLTASSGVLASWVSPLTLGSATPLMDGVGAAGNSANAAHENHVHPTDTSRAPIANPTFTGTVTGTFSGSLTGNCSGSAGSFTGNLAGDVTGPQSTTAIAAATVTGKALTGYVSGAGTITASDTILSAIQKLNANDATNANLTGMVTSVGNATTVVTNANLTGEVTSSGNATTVTNAAVIGKVLTGYTSGAGTVAATDTILQAIQKLNGNDATNANLTGEVTSVGNATTVTNGAVIGKVLSGYTSGAGTIAATDTILSAIQKLNGNDTLKANIADPTFTGVPAAPTAATGTNTTQLATTAFVQNTIPALVSLNALKFRYYADQLDFPRSTDWAVNLGAPSARDTTYPALTVRRFDAATVEGVGFTTVFPLLVTSMLVRIKAKAITAPAAAVGVVWRLHWRRFPDNGAPTAWTSLVLPTQTIPANTNFQYYSYSAALTTWGITAGDLTQFELVRVGTDANDTLVGDIALAALELEYMA